MALSPSYRALAPAAIDMRGAPTEVQDIVRKRDQGEVAIRGIHEVFQSPARRRNSSAEWPGPSSISVLANHLCTAAIGAATSRQPSTQALCNDSSRSSCQPSFAASCTRSSTAAHACLALHQQRRQLCTLCSLRRTPPRSQDRCLLMNPGIFNMSRPEYLCTRE